MKINKTITVITFLLLSFQLNANTLTDYLSKLSTFQASFVQSLVTPSAKGKQLSQGTLIVQSPNKFYIEYKRPYKLLYVADGTKLWSYDEDLEQVVVKEQSGLLVNSPAMLLSQPKNLSQSYSIKKVGVVKDLLWFKLTPKKEDSNFESIRFAFKGADIAVMEMRDNFGQVTSLSFDHVIKNAKINKNTFNFTPPQGVDVIGN